MPYKVYKLEPDKRNNTCGFTIPNGGFYHVVEMTFENFQQLQNISKRAGYSVDRCTGKPGFYDPDGYEVKDGTLTIDRISKVVTGYEKGPKRVHKTNERELAVRAATNAGLRVSPAASTQFILSRLSDSQRSRQASLA